MIGIVMPLIAFNREVRHLHDKSSILNQYKPLAKKYGVDLGLYSFRMIRPNLKAVEALVYSPLQDSVMTRLIAVPRVNIVRNTGYVKSRSLINKFAILHEQNIHFINFPLYRQANKLQNYEYLNSMPHLKKHVPPTKRLSYEQLRLFLHEYGKVIIKPIYGAKGRGITIIEKDETHYHIWQTPSPKSTGRLSRRKTWSMPHAQLEQWYSHAFGQRSISFLVQQWLPFMTYNGRPFDLRVVAQKNGKNRWQVTSRVARVAGKQGQITNLNQGGEMVSFSQMELKKFYRAIRELSLETAKALARIYPWAAEMGIDLAIDKNGKLWYIETNFCPEKTRWETICEIPFAYAYYLYKTI